MYFKYLETDKNEMREHNANQKAASAERLKRNAEWNRKNKPTKAK